MKRTPSARIALSLIGGVVLLTLSFCSGTPKKYDILIKNTLIVDGTGKPAAKGSLAIRDGRIVRIGRVGKGMAETTIDATGLVTCPGFVETHTHADMSIPMFPLAENLVMQGVTTILGGNCGLSPAPVTGLSLDQWLSRLEKNGVSVNVAMLVGHSTVRRHVMGTEVRRRATSEEVERMKIAVEVAMKDGAFGLSNFFDPGDGEFPRYVTAEEIIELAKVAARYGGIFSPHKYHHQNNWWTDDPAETGYGMMFTSPGEIVAGRYHGLLQTIEIARQANIPLLIAHLAPAYSIPQPHPEYLQEAAARATLEIISQARAEGLKVYFNAIACSFSIAAEEPMIGVFLNSQ